MGRKSHHVVHNPDGGWSVVRGGSARATKTFDKKKPAIEYGRALAKSHRSEFFIHGRDGRISDRRSYGKDPFPPRDMKR